MEQGTLGSSEITMIFIEEELPTDRKCTLFGVPYGAGYMWGVVCWGTLRSRVHVGSSVLGVTYGAGYMWGVVC